MAKWVHMHLRITQKHADALEKLSEKTGFDKTNLIRLAIARLVDSEDVLRMPLPRLDDAEE